jgi:hypothetical protein
MVAVENVPRSGETRHVRKESPREEGEPKAKAAKPAKKAEPAKNGKLSAIDAEAKVLGEAKEPINTRGMIEAMAKKGYGPAPAAHPLGHALFSDLERDHEQGERVPLQEDGSRAFRAEQVDRPFGA